MSDVTPPPDPAAEFAAALAAGDTVTAARLADDIQYGVEVDGDMATTGVVDGRSVVLCFVTFAAWERFSSGGEIRLLAPAVFAALVANLGVDDVLFDPSTQDATQVPAGDVLALLRGEARDEQGATRLMGGVQVLPSPALHERLHDLLPTAPVEQGGGAWALCRVAPGGSVPLVAVSPDVDDDAVGRLVAELGRLDLPSDLQVIRLGADDAEHAATQWQAVQL